MTLLKKQLALGLAIILSACGLAGGPSDAGIVSIAKQQMSEQLTQPGLDEASKKALQTALDGAKIEKKGICNNSKTDLYACIVEVTIKLPNQASETKQTYVVEIVKGAKGWEGQK